MMEFKEYMSIKHRMVKTSNFGFLRHSYNNGDTDVNAARRLLSIWNTRQGPPLVRCGECRYWVHLDESKDGYCKNPMGIDDVAQPLDFCSYGKRKEDENG